MDIHVGTSNEANIHMKISFALVDECTPLATRTGIIIIGIYAGDTDR